MMRGFNIGVNISLGDMETAIDYINNPDIFRPDIDNIIKKKLDNSDHTELTEAEEVEELTSASVLMSDDATINVIDDQVKNEESTDIEIELDEDEYFDSEETEDDIEISEEETEGNEVENEENEEYAEDEEEEEGYTLDELDSLEDEEDSDEGSDDSGVATVITTRRAEPAPVTSKTERELELERKLLALQSQLNKQVEQKEQQVTPKEQKQQVKIKPVDKSVDNYNSIVDKPISKIRDNSTNTRPQNAVKQRVNNASKQAGNHTNNASQQTGISAYQKRVEIYSGMEIEALYKEVKNFMAQQGVNKTTIDRVTLESEFGTGNIKKLLVKSYIISLGRGITIGK